MAVEVVKVVDPDSGAGFDYVSLASWESGEAKDLVTADEKATAKCRCTGGTADGGVAFSTSWITSNSCSIKVWTDPTESYRHNGTYQVGNKYRLEVTATGIANAHADYLKIIGVQVQLTLSSGSGIKCISTATGTGWIYVEKMMLRGVLSGTAQNCYGFMQNAAGGTVYVSNCIAYDFVGGGEAHYGFAFYNGTGTDIYCYNNTAQHCVRGYRCYLQPNVHMKNCIAQDCTVVGYFGAPDVATHNCSDDGSHPGINGQTGEVLFVDEAADDFHLSGDDIVAHENGINLYMDGNYRITDDIDSEARSEPWDIGADHYWPEEEEGFFTKIFYNFGG